MKIVNTQFAGIDKERKQLALVRKKIAKFSIDPNESGVFS